jgi:hypothetical protein
MGPARQRHHHPALLPWPTCQPLPSPSARTAARARRTSSAPTGFGPLPASCLASSTRQPGFSTPIASCLSRHRPKRSRTTLPRLGPLFPPPSSLRAPRGQTPHHLPVRPTLGAPPPPNSSHIAATVHTLGEPPTAPVFCRCRPHLTSLSLPPWCRARALSSATTEPAPPPSTATTPRRPLLHRRATNCVSPAADLLARRHPGTPPVLAGNTLPLASIKPHRRRAHHYAGARATRGDRTVSAHGARPVFARRGPPPRLGRAARPWPSRPSGRPRVAGRRAEHRRPWARLRPITVRRFLSFFNCFNCEKLFKLPKFVETCENVQKLQDKFSMNPLEPLFTVGLIKLTFV